MSVSARNKALSIFILLFLILSMSSCKSPKFELPGAYVADYDVAKEKLTLNRDGIYIQEVTLKSNSKVDVSKGTWTYNPNTQYVSFNENFMLVLNGFGKLNPDYAHPKPGGVSQPTTLYFGRMRIGSSEGIVYKKID